MEEKEEKEEKEKDEQDGQEIRLMYFSTREVFFSSDDEIKQCYMLCWAGL